MGISSPIYWRGAHIILAFFGLENTSTIWASEFNYSAAPNKSSVLNDFHVRPPTQFLLTHRIQIHRPTSYFFHVYSSILFWISLRIRFFANLRFNFFILHQPYGFPPMSQNNAKIQIGAVNMASFLLSYFTPQSHMLVHSTGNASSPNASRKSFSSASHAFLHSSV